jgi:hypothetical protein
MINLANNLIEPRAGSERSHTILSPKATSCPQYRCLLGNVRFLELLRDVRVVQEWIVSVAFDGIVCVERVTIVLQTRRAKFSVKRQRKPLVEGRSRPNSGHCGGKEDNVHNAQQEKLQILDRIFKFDRIQCIVSFRGWRLTLLRGAFSWNRLGRSARQG